MNRRQLLKALLCGVPVAALAGQAGKKPARVKTSEGIIDICVNGKRYCLPMLPTEDKPSQYAAFTFSAIGWPPEDKPKPFAELFDGHLDRLSFSVGG